MTWDGLDLADRVYSLEGKKTDRKRKRVRNGRLVPLTKRAVAIMKWVKYIQVKRNDYMEDFIWPLTDPRSCSRSIKRIYARAGIKNLRIHDLRHDFASVQSDIRLVAAVKGQNDLRSMKRYSHPDIKKSVDKIAGRSK